ncbi:hypothetical protein AWB74_00697 [Caballeronia arvi]|uniref:Natural resistance-associated macrophage protein n=1 Tax=Caballeronia arvi TaxID=1777135 RepID=A0A158FKH8_9BURK|nr:hypothetical protein [Caballeronia arvi]SAL19819.1 hypothetical protein AWB74_00697 [Caballeronia arvi]
MIANSGFLGYASMLADGDAAYLLWIIGALSLFTFVAGLGEEVRTSRWYRVLQSVALLALPALLLLGMVVSMIPPA